MRWIVAPLLAALVLTVSGALDALERYGEGTIALAESSEQAPETTAEAAAEVEDLPAIADLTSQQADAFEALADALELSAERVEALNEGLEGQVASVDRLESDLTAFGPLLRCAQERLTGLGNAAGLVPARISQIASTLEDVSGSSRKSVRHMRSINRKLVALGVVASAQGIEVPEPPAGQPLTDPPAGPEGRSC